MNLATGSLSDIAVVCPVQDLVRGKFPREILDPEYACWLDSFQTAKKEIISGFKNLPFSKASGYMEICFASSSPRLA